MSLISKPLPAKNRIIVWLSLVLAGVLLYFALRGLDWAQFFATIRNARYGWLPLLFAWSSLAYWLRAIRWQLLVQDEKPARLSEVFFANMAGYLGNMILPARAGEVIRAAYLGRRTGISRSFVLATGLVERLVDIAALIVIGGLSLSATGLVSETLQNGLALTSVLALIAILAIFLLPFFKTTFEKIIQFTPWMPEQLKNRLQTALQQFLLGLKALFMVRRALLFMLFTLLIWLMDGLGSVFGAFLLNIELNLLQAFVLLAGLGISSALPSTPGAIGIYQFVAILVLVPYGISNSEAIAYIVFVQIFGLLVVAAWGAPTLWQAGRSSR